MGREGREGERREEREGEGNDQSFILNSPHSRAEPSSFHHQGKPVVSAHTADVNSHPCGPKDSSCSSVGEY